MNPEVSPTTPPPSKLNVKLSGSAGEEHSYLSKIYHLQSFEVNGNPFWNEGNHAIWYSSDNSQWIIGLMEEVGSNRGYLYANEANGWPALLSGTMDWNYVKDGVWHKVSSAEDVTIKNEPPSKLIVELDGTVGQEKSYLSKTYVIQPEEVNCYPYWKEENGETYAIWFNKRMNHWMFGLMDGVGGNSGYLHGPNGKDDWPNLFSGTKEWTFAVNHVWQKVSTTSDVTIKYESTQSNLKLELSEDIGRDYLSKIYQIQSYKINDQPFWNKDKHAIWYNSDNSFWLIGLLEEVGSNRGYLYAKEENEWPNVLNTSMVWKYTVDQVWHDTSSSDDVIIKLLPEPLIESITPKQRTTEIDALTAFVNSLDDKLSPAAQTIIGIAQGVQSFRSTYSHKQGLFYTKQIVSKPV